MAGVPGECASRPGRAAPGCVRVGLADASAERGRRVRALLEECGFRVQEAGPEAARGLAAILLAGADCRGSCGPGPPPIQAWRQRGAAVLCYEDGLDARPVGERCRLLLAGASAVLDSAAPGFEPQLRAWAGRLLRAEGERRAEEEGAALLREGLGMVCESPAMRGVLRWMLRVGPLSDLPALITGETGTGKELVARAIHRLDPRRSRGPFVPVNCAAISPALAEGELFGHRRGAFTGADHERRGLLRSAEAGVLFLDEIGDMDLALQAKLLRVLQEGRVLAVGEDREVAVDVRVLAASNRDLEELVRQGQFRQDLLHRINAVSVRLPALRDRAEDIPALVHHLLGRHGPRQAGPPPAVGVDFLEALARAPLPGNVRELENLVRRALVGAPGGGPLGLADLPPSLWMQLSRAGAAPDQAAPPAAQADPLAAALDQLAARHGGNLARSLAALERMLLEAALRTAGGNQAATARRLGITARSVYNKLRKHRLDGRFPPG